MASQNELGYATSFCGIQRKLPKFNPEQRTWDGDGKLVPRWAIISYDRNSGNLNFVRYYFEYHKAYEVKEDCLKSNYDHDPVIVPIEQLIGFKGTVK